VCVGGERNYGVVWPLLVIAVHKVGAKSSCAKHELLREPGKLQSSRFFY
jgi:hypothetical protein